LRPGAWKASTRGGAPLRPAGLARLRPRKGGGGPPPGRGPPRAPRGLPLVGRLKREAHPPHEPHLRRGERGGPFGSHGRPPPRPEAERPGGLPPGPGQGPRGPSGKPRLRLRGLSFRPGGGPPAGRGGSPRGPPHPRRPGPGHGGERQAGGPGGLRAPFGEGGRHLRGLFASGGGGAPGLGGGGSSAESRGEALRRPPGPLPQGGPP
jgi:hypothetical protein